METIAHELAGHLSKYPEILDAFKKNGNYKDAKTIWDANSQEKDHEEMEDSKNRHNNYQKTMIELLKVLPNLKKYNEF